MEKQSHIFANHVFLSDMLQKGSQMWGIIKSTAALEARYECVRHPRYTSALMLCLSRSYPRNCRNWSKPFGNPQAAADHVRRCTFLWTAPLWRKALYFVLFDVLRNTGWHAVSLQYLWALIWHCSMLSSFNHHVARCSLHPESADDSESWHFKMWMFHIKSEISCSVYCTFEGSFAPANGNGAWLVSVGPRVVGHDPDFWK